MLKFLLIFIQISAPLARTNAFEIFELNDAGRVPSDVNQTADSRSLVCSTFPDTCSSLASISRRLFHLDAFEGRGPKDLIAIVSTMLATILGAILVKLNVLIVLTLISIAIGKILLVMLTLKTKFFAKTHQPPYEKLYYPHHHYTNQQSYDDYSLYHYSR